jgi:potassium channel subfamily K
VLLLLSVHSIANRKKDKDVKPEDERRVHRQVRVSGRHFMLSTTILLALIALMALIMSKVEGWSYLDGIYFSTVTVETIGFGDFSPTKAVTRALLAPLTILGIAYLGSLVQMIVDFFSKRSATRKERSRAMFERERQEAEDKAQNPANLVAEIEFLDKLNQGQDLKDQAWEFAMVSIVQLTYAAISCLTKHLSLLRASLRSG